MLNLDSETLALFSEPQDIKFWLRDLDFVLVEARVWVHSPKGVAPKGVSSRVFLNLRRMQEYGNLGFPSRKQLSFDFLNSFSFSRKEIFPWEHGNIWNWEAPSA